VPCDPRAGIALADDRQPHRVRIVLGSPGRCV